MIDSYIRSIATTGALSPSERPSEEKTDQGRKSPSITTTHFHPEIVLPDQSLSTNNREKEKIKQGMVSYFAQLHPKMDNEAEDFLNKIFEKSFHKIMYKKENGSYCLSIIHNRIYYKFETDYYVFPIKDFFSQKHIFLMDASSSSAEKKPSLLGRGTFNAIRPCSAYDLRNGQILQTVFKLVNEGDCIGKQYSYLTKRLDLLSRTFQEERQVRGLGLPLGYLEYVKITKDEQYRDKRVYIDQRYDGDLVQRGFRGILSLQPQSSIKLLLQVYADCLSGLAAMHNKGLWHGDIKGKNMLFSWDGQKAKGTLIDFDFVQSLIVGTRTYAAPECVNLDINNRDYLNRPLIIPDLSNQKLIDERRLCDLWSMGKSLLDSLDITFFPKEGMTICRNGKKFNYIDLLSSLHSYTYNKKRKTTKYINEINIVNNALKSLGWGFDDLIDDGQVDHSKKRVDKCQQMIGLLIKTFKTKAGEIQDEKVKAAYLDLIEVTEKMLSFDPAKRGSAEEHAKRLDALLEGLA